MSNGRPFGMDEARKDDLECRARAAMQSEIITAINKHRDKMNEQIAAVGALSNIEKAAAEGGALVFEGCIRIVQKVTP